MTETSNAVVPASDYTGNVVPIRTINPDFQKRGYKLIEILRSMPAGSWYLCDDGRARYKPWGS